MASPADKRYAWVSPACIAAIIAKLPGQLFSPGNFVQGNIQSPEQIW